MQLGNSPTRYGSGPQALHWFTVLVVIAAWLLGQFGDDLPESAHDAVVRVHITLGQLVVVLLIARLAWRIANPPPPAEPTRFGRLLEFAAKATHVALYALLIAVPVAGTMVQLKRGNPLPILGVWETASPWPRDRVVARSVLGIHELLANALLILAALHAAAALFHHWVLRDHTLTRMLPLKP